MSLAHFTTGAFWIVFFMGAAWTAPTTPSTGTQSKFEHDSQMQNEPIKVKATSENNRTESAATTSGVELKSEFPEETECHNSWQRFMVDFDVHYASEAETQTRRSIFCANWKRIQEHNVQYELGKVSFKKKINQWADLTFEEWKNKQRPNLAPEFPSPKPTSETSAVDQTRIKCEDAWKKFLIDFSRKYENDAETEQRRNIFCDNWKRIHEHNLQYDAGIVSHKKSINQWSDLTFEEWKKTQESKLPPNMETPGNKTEASGVKKFAERTPFPPNMEEPGTYIVEKKAPEVDQEGIRCQAAWEKFLVDLSPKYENDAETEKRRSIFCDNWKRIQDHNLQYDAGIVSHKKSINQWSDLTFEEWKKRQKSNLPPNMETPGNKTEASGVQKFAERTPFPPNMEEPGTYIVEKKAPEEDQEGIKCQAAWEKFLIDFSPKYKTDAETEKRRSIFCDNWKRIQDHNLQYDAGIVSHKKSINQWSDLTFEEWKKTQESHFPPNLETPGNKTKASGVQKLPERTPFPPNMEEPGTYIVEKKALEVDQEGIKCQAAWEKFLVDFSPKYENDAETEKRRSVFCDNWKRIQEHNLQYDLGIVSHKKSINQWSDLTFEQWKKTQESKLPPNMETPGNKTEASGVKKFAERTPFPPNMEEPGTYIVEKKAPEVDQDGIKCQAAWEKFLVDFSRKYKNDAETEQRRSIFCDNWKRILEHNLQYDAGIMSHKKSINQWSDLTFEEWKKTQESHFPPNMETPGNKTEASRIEKLKKLTNLKIHGSKSEASGVNPKGIKCQAAWKKFLADYSPKYVNDAETEIRHSIFCDNWQRTQEHNALFESGKVSHEESISEWSDLTSEELKSQSPNILPANLRPTEHKREATIEQVGPQKYWFPPNMEEPGIYVEERTIKPQEVDEELTDKVPRIEELKETANTKVPGNKTEATSVEVGSQQVWYPPNMEEPGIYLDKPPNKSESLSEELTDRVPSE